VSLHRFGKRGLLFHQMAAHEPLIGLVQLGAQQALETPDVATMSCHSATANQVRLVLHTAAFWLMHGLRAAIPRTSPLATAEFATIRERLIKISARVIERIARIRIHLPTSCPEAALFRTVALGLMRSGP
jgi:Transposase DDE domain group 1